MRYFQEALSINLFPLYFFTIKREHFSILKRFTKNLSSHQFFSHFPFLQKTLHKIRFHHQPDMAPQKSSSAHIESIYFCFIIQPEDRIFTIFQKSMPLPYIVLIRFQVCNSEPFFYFYLTTFLSRTFMDLDKIFYSVFFIISAMRKQTADTRSIYIMLHLPYTSKNGQTSSSASSFGNIYIYNPQLNFLFHQSRKFFSNPFFKPPYIHRI